MGTGKNSRLRSRQLAVCGMMCGLGVLFLAAGVIPLTEYCSPVLAMLPQLPVLEVWGKRAALGVYGATAVLGVILALQPEAVLLYLVLGYYPVLRCALQRAPGWIRPGVKGAVFLAAGAAQWGGTLLLLGGDGAAWGQEMSRPVLCLFLLLCALAFALLDVALGRLQRRFGPRWRRMILS